MTMRQAVSALFLPRALLIVGCYAGLAFALAMFAPSLGTPLIMLAVLLSAAPPLLRWIALVRLSNRVEDTGWALNGMHDKGEAAEGHFSKIYDDIGLIDRWCKDLAARCERMETLGGVHAELHSLVEELAMIADAENRTIRDQLRAVQDKEEAAEGHFSKIYEDIGLFDRWCNDLTARCERMEAPGGVHAELRSLIEEVATAADAENRTIRDQLRAVQDKGKATESRFSKIYDDIGLIDRWCNDLTARCERMEAPGGVHAELRSLIEEVATAADTEKRTVDNDLHILKGRLSLIDDNIAAATAELEELTRRKEAT